MSIKNAWMPLRNCFLRLWGLQSPLPLSSWESWLYPAWVTKVSVVVQWSFRAQRMQMQESLAMRVQRKVKGREMYSRAGGPYMDPWVGCKDDAQVSVETPDNGNTKSRWHMLIKPIGSNWWLYKRSPCVLQAAGEGLPQPPWSADDVIICPVCQTQSIIQCFPCLALV